MKIYFCTHHHTDQATSGADMYHYHLAELFTKWGWEVRSFSQQTGQVYKVGEVEVHPLRNHLDNEIWADAVITIPGRHLMIKRSKNVIVCKHNIGTENFRFDKWKILYCGEAVRQKVPMYCTRSFVWNPFNRYLNEQPIEQRGNVWLLVNCNPNKGGERLIELAKLCPGIQFRGILGDYGSQVLPKHPIDNLEYHSTGHDMTKHYKDAAGVLSLSQWEGFPTVLMEAMAFNLPVVALDIPGVRDVCADYASYGHSVADIAGILQGERFVLPSRPRAVEIEQNRDPDGLREFVSSL